MAVINNAKKSLENIKLMGDEKYKLVPRAAIQIASRTNDSVESFYNPREESSFTEEKLSSIIFSIRQIGLIEPPCVNAITDKNNKITKIELIAGERRKRSIDFIADNDLPCFEEGLEKPKIFTKNQFVLYKGDFAQVVSQKKNILQITTGKQEALEVDYSEVLPTTTGKKLYEYIPCKVIFNCSAKTAYGIAFAENEESEPITVRAEIELVERLVRNGWKQEEIAEINGNNITWVSQTASFRKQLPPEIFEKLLSGKMTRNVAVAFLSYPSEQRKSLAMEAIQVECQQTIDLIKKHQVEQSKYEEDAEYHLEESKRAKDFGDDFTANKELNKARINKEKADKAKNRKEKAISDRGVIRSGHVKIAATKIQVSPKKNKTLDAMEIDEYFIKTLLPCVTGEGIDPVTKNVVPGDFAAIARRIAIAIRNGNRDSIGVIRDYMVENMQWEAPPESAEESILDGLPDDDEPDNDILNDSEE